MPPGPLFVTPGASSTVAASVRATGSLSTKSALKLLATSGAARSAVSAAVPETVTVSDTAAGLISTSRRALPFAGSATGRSIAVIPDNSNRTV